MKTVRGTLSKNRDKWRIVISYYDDTGRRRQKTYSTGLAIKGNKRKAKEMLAEKMVDFEKNISGYTNANGEWIKNSASTLYAQWSNSVYEIALNNNKATTNQRISQHLIFVKNFLNCIKHLFGQINLNLRQKHLS